MKGNLFRQEQKPGENSRTTTAENKQKSIHYQSQRERKSNRNCESNNHTEIKICSLDDEQESLKLC